MHILYLSHYFPPEGNAPATRVHALGKRWVAAGHDVTVITCAPNVPRGVVYPGYRNAWCSRETIDGITVIRVWTWLAANDGITRRIANYVSYMLTATWRVLRIPKPDVLIATSPQFFCGWAGVLSARLRRIPFVLEIRDIWPESIAAVGAIGNRRILRFLEWLETKMYRCANRIVTVGEGYRRRLVEKGVPESKIDIVMNGLDGDVFKPAPADDALKAQWGLRDKFVCAYVGTIGMACGLDVTLRAAQRLRDMGRPDIAFLLVGDGAVRADLESAAKTNGLNQVVFTGRQDKSMIPAFIAISDVCLVHLRKSALFRSVMPSKIFEAAGMAKPVINGVAGFAADFVTAAGAGICIEPENDTELTEALIRLADDPDSRHRMGQSARDYVVTHCDRDTLANDYIRVLNDVRKSVKK